MEALTLPLATREAITNLTSMQRVTWSEIRKSYSLKEYFYYKVLRKKIKNKNPSNYSTITMWICIPKVSITKITKVKELFNNSLYILFE